MKNVRYILIGSIFLVFNGYVPQLLAENVQPVSLSESQAGKVILSWDEVKKLLKEIETLKQDIETLKKQKAQLQQAQTQKEKEKPVPVEYAITESQFTGEVQGLSAQFKAVFSVQVLKTGWLKIPFFQNDVGIEAISITKPNTSDSEGASGEIAEQTVVSSPTNLARQKESVTEPPAQFIRDANGYTLLAKGPTFLSIQVTFRVPIQVEELTYTLSFIPPRAVINHITLQIPEKEVNVVQKTAHSQIIQTQDDRTTIEAVLSERESLKLGWKVEKDSGINRNSQATLHALASIDKSDISVFSTLVLKYVASLDHIRFHLPPEVEIIDVTSLDIEQWTTEKLKDSQVVKIAGQVDPRDVVKIDISYRLRLSDLPADIVIPAIEIIGTDALEGFMGVEVLGNLEVNAKPVNNGVRIPAKNLPKRLWQKAANPLLYGYQFHGNTFAPSLSIRSYQEIQTVVANVDLVDCMTHRTLEGKSITRILYFIRNNDRQFLTLTLPTNSRLWQAFLNGKPVKPAQKNSGEILIPMKKSASQGGELRSFSIEVGYITEVNKLSLKGDILNQLPAIDIPISYLKWTLYLPEYYEYSSFEGLLKQVRQFSVAQQPKTQQQIRGQVQSQIDIPTQGRRFLFEKYLIVDGQPYIRGKYGQFLGDDIFLSLHASQSSAIRTQLPKRSPRRRGEERQDVYDYYEERRGVEEEAGAPQSQVAPNKSF
jgi:hypothetical protein